MGTWGFTLSNCNCEECPQCGNCTSSETSEGSEYVPPLSTSSSSSSSSSSESVEHTCTACGYCCFSKTSNVNLSWSLPTTNASWRFLCEGIEKVCETGCGEASPPAPNCLAFLNAPDFPCFEFEGEIELPYTRTFSSGGSGYVCYESPFIECGAYHTRFSAWYNCGTNQWLTAQRLYLYSGVGDIDVEDSYFDIGPFWAGPQGSPVTPDVSVTGNCCGNEPWEFYSVYSYNGFWTYEATITVQVVNNNCCKDGFGLCQEFNGACDGGCGF